MKKLSEPARQFAKIYEEHHSPATKEKKKILNNRKNRAEYNKKSLGL